MNSDVSLYVELPESLKKALDHFLDSRPDWDQDRTIKAALSLFLMQNGNSDSAALTYLNTMFSAEAVAA
jgi:hypothetical protein